MSQDVVRAWATFFFDRPASPDGPDASLFENEYDTDPTGCLGLPPNEAVNILAELHERYAEWAAIYTPAQLSQGLWAIFSHPYWFCEQVRTNALPFEPRARLVRSLAIQYETFLKDNPEEEMPNGWWMLWDLIADPEEDRLADVYLETLQRILAIDDPRCQQAALHGLNHLAHPDRPKIVQQWLDAHYDPALDWTWVEQCRDGLAM